MTRRLAVLVVACVLAACGGGDPARTAELYDTAPPAALPAQTDPVPADGPIPDGSYWADLVDAELTFRLTQWSFEDGLIDGPTRELVTPAGSLTTATVVDAATGVNYAVDGNELVRLADGQPPATPPGVSVTFDRSVPFLVTVRDSVVVSAFQVAST